MFEQKIGGCLGLLTRPNPRWLPFYKEYTELTLRSEFCWFLCLNVGFMRSRGNIITINNFRSNKWCINKVKMTMGCKILNSWLCEAVLVPYFYKYLLIELWTKKNSEKCSVSIRHGVWLTDKRGDSQ